MLSNSIHQQHPAHNTFPQTRNQGISLLNHGNQQQQHSRQNFHPQIIPQQQFHNTFPFQGNNSQFHPYINNRPIQNIPMRQGPIISVPPPQFLNQKEENLQQQSNSQIPYNTNLNCGIGSNSTVFPRNYMVTSPQRFRPGMNQMFLSPQRVVNFGGPSGGLRVQNNKRVEELESQNLELTKKLETMEGGKGIEENLQRSNELRNEKENLKRKCAEYQRLYEDQKKISNKTFASGMLNTGSENPGRRQDLENQIVFLNKEIDKRNQLGGSIGGGNSSLNKALEDEIEMFRKRENEFNAQKAKLNDVLFQFVLASTELENLKTRIK